MHQWNVTFCEKNCNSAFFAILAKDCGQLLTPKNGSMSGGWTTFPNEVNFSCDKGFIMKGPDKRRCKADGTWSGNVTSCEGMAAISSYFADDSAH